MSTLHSDAETESGTADRPDFDWIAVGSGFGGSVAALRLVEKGYRVAVIERGRSYEDAQLPTSTTDPAYTWAPGKDQFGIMRSMVFRHVVTASQTGVGGGSLIYGGVLFRPQSPSPMKSLPGVLVRMSEGLVAGIASNSFESCGVGSDLFWRVVRIGVKRRVGMRRLSASLAALFSRLAQGTTRMRRSPHHIVNCVSLCEISEQRS